MFIGEYSHSVDEKGRLAIPKKFQQKLKGGAVVTRGLDQCLFLYTKKDWQQLAARIAKLPISQANTRAFARLMLAGAMDVELDKQGRVVLPDYLRRYAGIGKSGKAAVQKGGQGSGAAGKVVVAGLMNRLEVWDAKEWENYKSTTERTSGDIAENLGELGV